MSCTKLTVELLTNISIGKGAHAASEAVCFQFSNINYFRNFSFINYKYFSLWKRDMMI
jgi:hypothetical protein